MGEHGLRGLRGSYLPVDLKGRLAVQRLTDLRVGGAIARAAGRAAATSVSRMYSSISCCCSRLFWQSLISAPLSDCWYCAWRSCQARLSVSLLMRLAVDLQPVVRRAEADVDDAVGAPERENNSPRPMSNGGSQRWPFSLSPRFCSM